MKKIYAAAALILAAFTGANAQLAQVDLAALAPVVEVGTDGQGQPALVLVDNKGFTPVTGRGISTNFSLTANTFDSLRARAACYVTGSGETLVTNDKFAITNPSRSMDAQGALGFRVYTLSQDFDTTYLLDVEDALTATDSIQTLMDIDSFENGTVRMFENIMVRRSELIVGKVYGWFSNIRVYPWDETEPGTYRDTIQTNNWAYTPIIWGSNVGIGKGFSTQYDKMDVYPNPANGGKINYSADVKKASSFQTVRIMDLVGRNMVTENKGATTAGKVSGTLDISALAAGTYTIQVITEYGVSATKFVKD